MQSIFGASTVGQSIDWKRASPACLGALGIGTLSWGALRYLPKLKNVHRIAAASGLSLATGALSWRLLGRKASSEPSSTELEVCAISDLESPTHSGQTLHVTHEEMRLISARPGLPDRINDYPPSTAHFALRWHVHNEEAELPESKEEQLKLFAGVIDLLRITNPDHPLVRRFIEIDSVQNNSLDRAFFRVCLQTRGEWFPARPLNLPKVHLEDLLCVELSALKQILATISVTGVRSVQLPPLQEQEPLLWWRSEEECAQWNEVFETLNVHCLRVDPDNTVPWQRFTHVDCPIKHLQTIKILDFSDCPNERKRAEDYDKLFYYHGAVSPFAFSRNQQSVKWRIALETIQFELAQRDLASDRIELPGHYHPDGYARFDAGPFGEAWQPFVLSLQFSDEGLVADLKGNDDLKKAFCGWAQEYSQGTSTGRFVWHLKQEMGKILLLYNVQSDEDRDIVSETMAQHFSLAMRNLYYNASWMLSSL